VLKSSQSATVAVWFAAAFTNSWKIRLFF